MKNKKKSPAYQKGGIITDNMGQLAHPGKVTKINSNNITMKGVNYPVLGISDLGQKKIMLPNQDYTFKGSSVTEFPMAKSGAKIKSKKQQGGGVPMARGPEYLNINPKSNIQSQKTNAYLNLTEALRFRNSLKGLDNSITSITGKGTEHNTHANQYVTVDPFAIQKADSVVNASQNFLGLVPKKTYKKGGKIKKSQLGSSNPAIDGSTQVDLNNPYQSQGIFDMYGGNQTQQYLPQNQGNIPNLFNKVGGLQGIGQGIGNIGAGIAMGDQQQSVGASTAQNVVSQFGPWGKIIGGVSKLATNFTNQSNNAVVGTLGTTIFDPAAAWTNKDLSKSDRILGGLNPIYGGFKAYKARQAKKTAEKKLKRLVDKASHLTNTDVRQYNRPEDQLTDPNTTVSTYGTGTNYLKNGGNLPTYAIGGELKTHWGGKAKSVSFNPYLPGMGESVEFIGNSHSESDNKGRTGIGITFGKNMVEVEQGEPAVKLQEGGSQDNLVIFGDMKIPSYGLTELNDPKAKGKKFKSYIKDLNKLENKNNKIIDKHLISSSQTEPTTSFDKLKISSDTAMITGADMNLKNIASKKQTASSIQNAILDTASEYGLNSSELAKGKITKAKKSEIAQNGKRVIPRMAGDASQYYVERSPEIDSVITPISDSTEAIASPAYESAPERKNWFDVATTAYNAILPYVRPTNNLPLGQEQLAGERYALATNQLEGVQAQKYTPLLEQATDISLQDQLNANQAEFNALQRATSGNPAIQATLAAQKYAANSSVLGEQFRLNQSNKMATYNKNREILNDATLKNLAILDQQYTRQTQAKANTKAVAKAALESIGNKIAQNKLENRILDIDQQRYNYRFGPNGAAWNLNPLQQFIIPQVGSDLPIVDENGNVTQMAETVEKRDSKGRIITTENKNRTTKKSSNGSLIKSLKSY